MSVFGTAARDGTLAAAVVLAAYMLPTDALAQTTQVEANGVQPAATIQPPIASRIVVPFESAQQEAALRTKMKLFMAELNKAPETSQKPTVHLLKQRALDVLYGNDIYRAGDKSDNASKSFHARDVYGKVSDEFLIRVAKWATGRIPIEEMLDFVSDEQGKIDMTFLWLNSNGYLSAAGANGAIPSKPESTVRAPTTKPSVAK